MSRNLTRQERIEARHRLQELSEQAQSVRNAMDPVSGMMAVSDETWRQQWLSLRRELDAFTSRVCTPLRRQAQARGGLDARACREHLADGYRESCPACQVAAAAQDAWQASLDPSGPLP
jgi:hypothetical protein